jgi:hypothetical protein
MRDPHPWLSSLPVAAHPDRRRYLLDRWRGCYRPPLAAASVPGTWQQVPTE